MTQRFKASWWSAVKLRDLQMRGDSWDPTNPKAAPNLSIGLGEGTGKPAFNVYLNDGSPKDKNFLRVQLNNWDLQTIFQLVEEAVASDTVYNKNYEINTIFKGSEALPAPVKVATIHIIRTPEGVIKLAIRAGTKKPTFTFKTPYPNSVKDGTGEIVDAGMSSRYAAQSWVNIFRTLTINIIADLDEPPKKEPSDGGYNSSYNSNAPRQAPVIHYTATPPVADEGWQIYDED